MTINRVMAVRLLRRARATDADSTVMLTGIPPQ